MLLSWLFNRKHPTRAGPAPMQAASGRQVFTPGPGPGAGMHSTQYKVPNPLAAPRPPVHSMARANGGQQSWVYPFPVNDNQYHFEGFNNGGLGQLMNATAAVQNVPILQWSSALAAPARASNVAVNPTRGIGEDIRATMRVAAPVRPQSIPGYVVTQSQVTNNGINSSLVALHRNLRAPSLSESQSSMC